MTTQSAYCGVFVHPNQSGRTLFGSPKIRLCGEWLLGGKVVFVGVLRPTREIPTIILGYVWQQGVELLEIVFAGTAIFEDKTCAGYGVEMDVPPTIIRSAFDQEIRMGESSGGNDPKTSVWILANPDSRKNIRSLTLLDEGAKRVYQFVDRSGKIAYNNPV